METKPFKTRTSFLDRKNPAIENAWPEAIDIGYSSVKGMCGNKIFTYPSYAREISMKEIVSSPTFSDILYRGEEGDWCIGEKANAMIKDSDTNDSVETLYGRNRYFQPMFQVIARTALGISILGNRFGNYQEDLPIILQTGLPPDYVETDSDDLKDALCGEHHFSMRLGFADWLDFDFRLERDNIRIMDQPTGSMFGAAMRNDLSLAKDAHLYMAKNTIIFDPGFSTLDVFSIRGGIIEFKQTFNDLGMKEVFSRTIKEIHHRYGITLKIHALQKYLDSGEVIKFDKKTMQRTKIPFDSILCEMTNEVCLDALNRIKPLFNYFADYDYFIVTGGTGAAWHRMIKEYFSQMEGLVVLSANQNDTSLSNIYSNVRGYYLYLLSSLKAEG